MEKNTKAKRGVSAAKVRAVKAAGGHLSLGTVLRQRLRHFSRGVALGQTGFIEEIFVRFRSHFSQRRQTGARRLRGDLGRALTDQRALRDLR